MSKEDSKSFESSLKCWVCDNAFVEGYIKVEDHCTSLESIKGKAEHRV